LSFRVSEKEQGTKSLLLLMIMVMVMVMVMALKSVMI
jgi:hypothetical protein